MKHTGFLLAHKNEANKSIRIVWQKHYFQFHAQVQYKHGFYTDWILFV